MCFAAFGSTASSGAAAGGSGSLMGGLAQLAPSVLGAVGSATSSANSTAANAALLRYQQNNALTNEGLANARAADYIQQGEDQAVQLSQKARQIKGSQRAAFAANGVRLDSGSAVNVQQSTDHMRDVDLATIRNNAARAAWGQKVTASNYGQQASAYAAGASAQSPGASGFSSLLGSASGVAGKWYQLYKGGGFGGSSTGFNPEMQAAYSGFDNPANFG